MTLLEKVIPRYTLFDDVVIARETTYTQVGAGHVQPDQPKSGQLHDLFKSWKDIDGKQIINSPSKTTLDDLLEY